MGDYLLMGVADRIKSRLAEMFKVIIVFDGKKWSEEKID